MVDWIICPGCNLKHTARPDGTCPRCRQPISAFGVAAATPGAAPPGGPEVMPAPASTPGAPAVATPGWGPAPEAGPGSAVTAPAGDAGFPLGSRLAGLLLLLNAALNLAGLFVLGTSAEDRLSVKGWIVDVVIGALLLARKAKIRPWAIVRAVIGGLVFGGIAAFKREWVVVGMQAALSGGLLLLLVRRPRLPRLVFGLASAGAIVAFSAAVVGLGAAGVDVVARLSGAGGEHLSQVAGQKVPWKLALPPGHWHTAPASDDVQADARLLWPEHGAYLLAFSNEAEGASSFDVDKLADIMIENQRQAMQQFEVKERVPLPKSRADVRIVRAYATSEGQEIVEWLGVVTLGNRFVHLVLIAPRREEKALGEEMNKLAGAVEL